jgi:hypothetical protein
MRLPRRLGVAGQLHDLIDLGLRDARLAAPTGPDLAEFRQPLLGEPGPPRTHRRSLHPDPRSDLGVRNPLAGQQQHLSALHLPMRRRLGPGQPVQRLALTIRHHQRGCSSVHP